MGWRPLERWATVATIALYVAAAASMVIMLGESQLPEGSPLQRVFQAIAGYLNRLGNIGGGAIIIVILFIMVGGGTVMLLLKTYDQFQENRKRRAREREEAIAEGRAEGRAEIRDRLKEQGIDLDDLLPPGEQGSDGGGWLFP